VGEFAVAIDGGIWVAIGDSEAWQLNELTGVQECYETIKTPVYSEDGQLIGLLGVVKNVTKIKQAEEVLRNQKLLG
jgi:hypothetical protein